MAPSRDFLQRIQVCEAYALEHKLVFSTDPVPSKSKTKCMLFCGSLGRVKYPAPLQLAGKEHPMGWDSWASWTYSQLTKMEKDCHRARGRFKNWILLIHILKWKLSRLCAWMRMEACCVYMFSCFYYTLQLPGSSLASVLSTKLLSPSPQLNRRISSPRERDVVKISNYEYWHLSC